MSSIFGILQRDGAVVAPSTLVVMQYAIMGRRLDGCDVWLGGNIGMGQIRQSCSSESGDGQMNPSPLPTVIKGINEDIVITATGRVDNRDELIRELAISDRQTVIPDSKVILHAFCKWGEDCPKHIYGDWSFAVWHPRERRLFLARDHYGNTSLYYYADERVFAFASDRKALLAMNLAPIKMDELYLAQILVSWPARHGERTIHTPIKRLPPAHCLIVTHERLDTRQYWRLEETPELRLPGRNDYVEAFCELFDEAVRCRLKDVNSGSKTQENRGNGDRHIAVSLSGGLDSGSVTATAARLLRKEGKRLTAFTSVPMTDTGFYTKKSFNNEFPLASATARYAGNVDLYPVTAQTISPIQAIRRSLEIHNEPLLAAGNSFWILALEEAARAKGCRVLLTGQSGNAGISWTGDVFSQPLSVQLSHYGWRKWAKERVKLTAPDMLLKAYRRARMPKVYSWCKSYSIHPDFARRLNLPELRLNDTLAQPRSPQENRFRMLMPGRDMTGALIAEMGEAYGLDVRDPTADVRVLAFTFSVPDHIFMDPTTGLDRWLIRKAMEGRLPDEVRLNRLHGRQAADLVLRLRACAAEVEDALDELAVGPAAVYVDVPYLREVWSMFQTQNTLDTFRKAISVFTRVIMAGLWVNDFYDKR